MVELQQTLRRLWSLRWENEQKEGYWRLTVNGFTAFHMHAADRIAGRPIARCPCGIGMERGDRLHHFWDFAVAQAVCDEIRSVSLVDVSIAHVWQVCCPTGLHDRVWDVVCLALQFLRLNMVGAASMRRMRKTIWRGHFAPPATLQSK